MSFFARRTDAWDGESNALDKAIEALPSSQVIYDLTQSNPTKAQFTYPSTWAEALANPEVLSYDPQSFGLVPTREAITAYYRRRGYQVDGKRIILTSSSSESYAYVLRLLLNPYDKVLIPAPSYPLFPYLLDIQDAAYETYQLQLDSNWSIDRDSVLNALDETVRIIMVVSPNNPTGSFISTDDRQWLVQLAKERSMTIVADEVFMDYGFDTESLASFVNEKECLTFVMGGLSKTACLPGMKLGWLIVSGPEYLVNQACDRLEIMTDTYLSVNIPVQLAAVEWLNDVDIIQDEVKARLQRNLAYAKAHHPSQLELIIPQAGWYLIARLPAHFEDEMFCLKAVNEGVLIYPGYFFDMPGDNFIVVSLLTHEPTFYEGWKKLCQMI